MAGIRNLILVLGDQLSPRLSSLADADPDRDVVLMSEVADETTYVKHHKQKIAFVLSAMRHFAQALRDAGWRVDYIRLNDPENAGSFTGELKRAVARHKARRVVVTEPGEWRVLEMMRDWQRRLGIPVDIRDDDRFLCSRADFAAWAEGRRELRMEYFYREMRKRTGLLMDHDRPEGGRWNFDRDNRRPADRDLFMPKRLRFEPDAVTREVLDLVAARFPDHFGDLEPFGWAVTAADAKTALENFIDQALPRFGDNQDAMLTGDPFLYHSLLSPYINVGLLDPVQVCRAAEAAWRKGRAPINAVEGFVRQIVGWREYVRGVYWLKMPDYADSNFLDASRPLPWFYWSGETDMACLADVIGRTRREAYAHHIERLMVAGTFAMLAGVEPRQIHEWYLIVYIDAFEWVELPNVIGMSQYADGGVLGSKPYAASGAYIDRMSDFCGGCRYDVKQRTGPDACPFNALYWDFLDRNAGKLRGNPRLGPIYKTLERMDEQEKRRFRESAAAFLAGLE